MVKLNHLILLCQQRKLLFIVFLLAVTVSRAHAYPQQSTELDQQLAELIEAENIQPIPAAPPQDPAKVELGQNLFFDKILSGNRDISCATCHHPTLASHDGRALPIGAGGIGLGAEREMGTSHTLIPRNAPEIFNRGDAEWETMFWDGRVATDIYFDSPAGDALPDMLDSVLAAQAMFPPTSAHEMRGNPTDPNELAPLTNVNDIWDGLAERLRLIEGYGELFEVAYPDTPIDQIGFEHAANAIAAFEVEAFSFNDSPWDQYLTLMESGESRDDFLTADQKAGALLFYGEANCASCHSGYLMTDQNYYNIAIPQFGPGKDEDGMDYGRYLETNEDADMFKFRTPPLANVALTAPYMHNGAYTQLTDAIRHHIDPTTALAVYDSSQLDPITHATYEYNPELNGTIIATLSAEIEAVPPLTDAEIAQLEAFLNALSSPSADDMERWVPDIVPSELPVADDVLPTAVTLTSQTSTAFTILHITLLTLFLFTLSVHVVRE